MYSIRVHRKKEAEIESKKRRRTVSSFHEYSLNVKFVVVRMSRILIRRGALREKQKMDVVLLQLRNVRGIDRICGVSQPSQNTEANILFFMNDLGWHGRVHYRILRGKGRTSRLGR